MRDAVEDRLRLALARLPAEDVGDAEPDILYRAVGRALSEWEAIELVTAWIFSRVAESSNEGVSKAFGDLASGKARVDFLEAVASAYFLKNPNLDLQAKLGRLLDLRRTAAERRNDIAHGAVGLLVNQEGFSRRWFLMPPEYAARRQTSKAGNAPFQYAYTARQIDGYADVFVKCAQELRRFLSDVTGETSSGSTAILLPGDLDLPEGADLPLTGAPLLARLAPPGRDRQ